MCIKTDLARIEKVAALQTEALSHGSFKLVLPLPRSPRCCFVPTLAGIRDRFFRIVFVVVGRNCGKLQSLFNAYSFGPCRDPSRQDRVCVCKFAYIYAK